MKEAEESAHVSPLSVVQRFLLCLTHADADGRVVLEGGDDPALKFIMLNPAVHFKHIIQEVTSFFFF